MNSMRLDLRIDPVLLARVDVERGDVPRAAWIRRVLERELAGVKASPTVIPGQTAIEVVEPRWVEPPPLPEGSHPPQCDCPACI